MDDIGDSLRQTILEQNVEMLLANKIQPTALANGLVPVDIDVTPMDNSKSKKEGVSRLCAYDVIYRYRGVRHQFRTP